jgi:REP element-mobilizing transposase RayT
MDSHRRRLPHVYPEGKLLFVTWHLHGSLPHHLYPPKSKSNAGQAFVWMDRYLDTTRSGPKYLGLEKVAAIVQAAVYYGAQQLKRYDLEAYVIMPNHVHMLILPHESPSQLMQTLKGYTARMANKQLGTAGQPFWQAESYDHWARNQNEANRIKAYIENNPVKAGLAAHAKDFRWSSAADRRVGTTADSAGLAARAT